MPIGSVIKGIGPFLMRAKQINDMKHSILLSSLVLLTTSASAQMLPLFDDFNGTSLNGANWTSGATGTSPASADIQVSEGVLSLGLTPNGGGTSAYVQSVRNDFNFFQDDLTLTWNIGASGVGDVPSAASYTAYTRAAAGWGVG